MGVQDTWTPLILGRRDRDMIGLGGRAENAVSGRVLTDSVGILES